MIIIKLLLGFTQPTYSQTSGGTFLNLSDNLQKDFRPNFLIIFDYDKF